jgi:hypothetical protein
MNDDITHALQRNNFIALQHFSKSVHSDHNSNEGNAYRNKQRFTQSKDFCCSEMKESSEKRNHSRIANKQLNSRLKNRNNCLKHNKTVDKSKKKEIDVSMHTSCQRRIKHQTAGHTKLVKPQRSI